MKQDNSKVENRKDKGFNELVSNRPENLRNICIIIRTMILDMHPEAVELVWHRQNIASYGVGPKKMSEHYAYIGIFKAHVNLGFYHGTSLDDKDNLLEGTGKELRHIKIRNIEDLDNPDIKRLIMDAFNDRLNEVGDVVR